MATTPKTTTAATKVARASKSNVVAAASVVSATVATTASDLPPYKSLPQRIQELEPKIQHLLNAADPAVTDPMYDTYLEYLDLLDQRNRVNNEHKSRAGANLEVPTSEGRKINLIGTLVGGEDDTMTLHTVEAARLYNGFTPSADSAGRFFVPGARRAAIALRQLFLMTALDNPYADYLLVQIDERVAAINKDIASLEKEYISKLDVQKKKGLSYSILETRTPQVLTLGYKSPYGYMLSGLVVNFDYLVRVLKSAERRDLCTKRDVTLALATFKHSLRSMFMLAIEGARSLSHDSLAGLSRSDWLPQSSEVSKKRVVLALDAFKTVPQSIFLGTIEPRHSIRRYNMSAQDKQLLAATIAKSNADAALIEKAGDAVGAGAASESGLAD